MEGAANRPGLTPAPDDPTGLLALLARLDALIAYVLSAEQSAAPPGDADDAFRGLHIGADEVARLLATEPGRPLLPPGAPCSQLLPSAEALPPRLAALVAQYSLAAFDIDVLLIALAPEFDLRYERLYAYLQDDITRRRPTVDLALSLLCATPAERLARRAHFTADAPLFRGRLLHLFPDPAQPAPPLLAQYLKPDEQIVSHLAEEPGLDRRLTGCSRLIAPTGALAEAPLLPGAEGALVRLAGAAPARFYFQGPPGAGKGRAAEALAHALGRPLLVADLRQALGAGPDFTQTVHLIFQAAMFQDAVLYLTGLAGLAGEEHRAGQQALLAALSRARGVVILAGAQPWSAVPALWEFERLGVAPVVFAVPDFAGRRAYWQAHLVAAAIPVPAPVLDALAGRFRLVPDQISAAIAAAETQAHWQAATQPHPPLPRPAPADLFAAARAQAGQDLATLATRLDPIHTWDDLVLEADAVAQLQEMCERVDQGPRVLDSWGFGRKVAGGKGVTALFVGPSGTGKTLAAEIIARALDLDLYKIDLSGVVSKYIGETEKNLDRIFSAAEQANVVLLFDEADALFGKRSEVRDAHDRYANIETSYLLQKMEQYAGIAILTTNLRGNLDEAFVRRVAFTVHFPFPDEASRRRIWAGVWPAATPLAGDVDLDGLARQFKLSGGNIKNIALAAAFRAAAAGSPVTQAHLLHALRREYQKMGKALTPAELAGGVLQATG